eukprot:scaffold141973_cov31-Tisochrysis_lutea.AAC.3
MQLRSKLVEEEDLVEAVAAEALIEAGYAQAARQYKWLEALLVGDLVLGCLLRRSGRGVRALSDPCGCPTLEVSGAVSLSIVPRVKTS